MKVVIIAAAGISSRFNEGIPKEQERNKIIFYEEDWRDTLLFHLLQKSMSVDWFIIVGGNQFNELKKYCELLPIEYRRKIFLVFNEYYAEFSSGYSLYLGIKEAFEKIKNIKEILFIEGDLDVDEISLKNVINTNGNILTYCKEPIFSKKSVVLYKNDKGNYRYVFNSEHGFLKINDFFSEIYNSGQIWKFSEINKLKFASEKFYEENCSGTNLGIIQNYIELCSEDSFTLIGFLRWINCNTRKDYKEILSYWKEGLL